MHTSIISNMELFNNGVVEVRIPKAGKYKTISGYFNDMGKLAEEVNKYDGKVQAIYFTLNPTDAALLARANNKLKPYAEQTTSDADITHRHFMLIDADADRPAGISATDEEKAAVWDVMQNAIDFLKDMGFHEPITADSGNGYHALYKIDLPNNTQSTELIKKVLEGLASLFDTDKVRIDTAVYNAARITKAYGTMVKKGEHTQDRPHRRSGIINIPECIQTNEAALLEGIAALAPEKDADKKKPDIYSNDNNKTFIEQFIDKHLSLKELKPWNGLDMYLLDSCPFNPEHRNGEAKIFRYPNGKLTFNCFHNSCQGYKWHDVRRKYEPGYTPGQWNNSTAGEDFKQYIEAWEQPIPFHAFDLPAFPIEVLPDWIKAFVYELSQATQTPIDMAAFISMSVLSAAVGKKYKIEMKDGWQEPLNIYTLVILPPGERKSAVVSSCIEPIIEYERQANKEKRLDVARMNSKKKILEDKLKNCQGKAAKSGEKEDIIEAERAAEELALFECERMFLSRILADDATPEKLANILHEQGGHIAIITAEGGLFDIMAGKYSQNGTANIEVFLKGHAGDDLRVDRIGRPPEHIEQPAITIGMAAQPDVLNGLFYRQSFRGRGLLGRFLYSIPRSYVGARNIDAPPMNVNTKLMYSENIKAILGLEQPLPELITLSHEAYIASQDYARQLEPKLAQGEELGHIADWAGKLHGAIGRIAGLLHIAKYIGAAALPPVSQITMQQAILLSDYLTAHAQAAFGCMGADKHIEKARTVLRWIEKGQVKEFSKRDAHFSMRGTFKRVSELEPILDLLEEHSYIRKQHMEEVNRPGNKPSQKYKVNPMNTLHTLNTLNNSVQSVQSVHMAEEINLEEGAF